MTTDFLQGRVIGALDQMLSGKPANEAAADLVKFLKEVDERGFTLGQAEEHAKKQSEPAPVLAAAAPVPTNIAALKIT